MHEARRYSRSQVALIAALHLDGGRVVTGTTTDIAGRGFFLVTQERVEVGERGDFRIRLQTGPVSLQIEGEGVVARVTERGLGIELEAVALESFSHLRELVRFNSDDADRVDEEFRAGGGAG